MFGYRAPMVVVLWTATAHLAPYKTAILGPRISDSIVTDPFRFFVAVIVIWVGMRVFVQPYLYVSLFIISRQIDCENILTVYY